ncbi:putative ribosome biogenesis protein C8F11.04 isoform X2 [Vicia villosa]|uniref:putative ribosome biogenesis protein C8F11.04 isoform X2 n=1 Tax=Vicia villosa TaxID=3911 RepID=UPI00273C1DD7|nr:putative ribosome biogenesis protein C8F11.04 isoform X2 [Vicia villosa]
MASENPKAESALEDSKVEAITKAVDSLLKWHKSRSETEKPKLFEEEDFIYLVLTLKKIPTNGRVNPHKIPIPHSLLSPSSEQCLIIDDRANKPARLTKDEAKKKIQSESIPISKILKLSKLTTDYRPFEAKRKLCNSYDLFFADKTVVPLLPRLLGKQFFKKRKVPVQLDLKKKNWKEQIDRALSSALLFLRTGTCSVLKVAKMSMERDQIVENLAAAMEGVVEVFPKKWGVVRSFHVKLLDSVALPVYQVVPDVRLKIEGVKDLEAALVKDEKKVRDGKDGKKSKKGRIHEIKYMDDRMSEEGDVRSDVDVDVADIDIDDDAVGGGDKLDGDHENGEIESGGIRIKKRKKGVKGKKEALSEAGSVKSLKGSAKRKKKDVLETVNAAEEEGSIKKGKDKLFTEDAGSDKKTKRAALSEAGSVKSLKGSAKRKKKNVLETVNVNVNAADESSVKKGKDKLFTEDAGSDKKTKRADVKVKGRKS